MDKELPSSKSGQLISRDSELSRPHQICRTTRQAHRQIDSKDHAQSSRSEKPALKNVPPALCGLPKRLAIPTLPESTPVRHTAKGNCRSVLALSGPWTHAASNGPLTASTAPSYKVWQVETLSIGSAWTLRNLSRHYEASGRIDVERRHRACITFVCASESGLRNFSRYHEVSG